MVLCSYLFPLIIWTALYTEPRNNYKKWSQFWLINLPYLGLLVLPENSRDPGTWGYWAPDSRESENFGKKEALVGCVEHRNSGTFSKVDLKGEITPSSPFYAVVRDDQINTTETIEWTWNFRIGISSPPRRIILIEDPIPLSRYWWVPKSWRRQQVVSRCI